MRPKKSRLAAFFDTETTSLADGRAFAYAYIWRQDGRTRIYRDVRDIVDALESLAAEFDATGETQIVGVYNLAFDWTPLESAVSGGGWQAAKLEHARRLLTIDLTREGDEVPAIRFWDMAPLVPEGLATIGRLAGVPKLEGGLDYSQIRTPSTPLTAGETAYMRRDVEVLEAFAARLTEWHEFIHPDDLGRVAITNASIARLFMRRAAGRDKIGKRSIQAEHLRTRSRLARFSEDWQKEIRREAYAGGFTFVNPAFLWKTVEGVQHFDMDSAYHFAPLALETPTAFAAVHESLRPRLAEKLEQIAGEVREAAAHGQYPSLSTPAGGMQFHSRITLEGLAAGTGPGYRLAETRFAPERLAIVNASGANSGAGHADGITAEFSKVTSARRLTVTVDENEFAALALGYEWQALRVDAAELATHSEQLPLPLVASAALRAEKVRRKTAGGPQYDFFKRIYNSTAGIWAQAAGAEDRHSLEYLPLAIRQTSWARLKMACTLHALDRAGLQVLSGDTDSIKVAGPRVAVAAAINRVENWQAVRPIPQIYEVHAPDLAKVGRFQFERTASLHREMAPKMRAWWTDGDDSITIKAAGLRSGGLAATLTALAREHGPAFALGQLKPWTWLDTSIAKEVRATRPESPAAFTLDLPGFNGQVQPAIHLADSLACIANPAGMRRAERLHVAGQLDTLEEGWLDATGWHQFNEEGSEQ